ncbi:MAG: cysteinyl-tRNA synthetase [Methanomassiliicoccales archaeon PtaB.Bin215]|nr:MAG: cysteinyl-tRNA synthetase [Methanomassiliicoccales archaeon PtaB.Bin215]
MTLQIYNTMAKAKQEFRPIDDAKVKMYVCGVTVYDDVHMGHARFMVVFDMVSRYLRYRGFDVTLVINFTDVDDKIIKRANEEGVDALVVSRRCIESFFRDSDALRVKRANMYPKASETIPEIIGMVEDIIKAGFGYVTPDGSVYFDVSRTTDYGKLSGNKLEEMISGARIEVDEIKRNPMDFCLWKAAKPGEISWDSPWGKGRPGWHIECSAMVRKLLGETIDIHGGGNDLIFPHHENEILQSESVTNKPLANYWMHNGMLQVADAKMSKSLKNFFSVKDILARYQPEVVRFYLLNTHYRGPLVYGEAALDEAAASLKRLHNTYESLRSYTPRGKDGAEELVVKTKQGFLESMDDDFNSRGALSFLFDLAREANRLMDSGELSAEGAANIISMFNEMNAIFDVLPEERKGDDKLDDVMLLLIDIRKELRKRKMYDLSDLIRDRLQEAGIKIEDTSEGAKWKLI